MRRKGKLNYSSRNKFKFLQLHYNFGFLNYYRSPTRQSDEPEHFTVTLKSGPRVPDHLGIDVATGGASRAQAAWARLVCKALQTSYEARVFPTRPDSNGGMALEDEPEGIWWLQITQKGAPLRSRGGKRDRDNDFGRVKSRSARKAEASGGSPRSGHKAFCELQRLLAAGRMQCQVLAHGHDAGPGSGHRDDDACYGLEHGFQMVVPGESHQRFQRNMSRMSQHSMQSMFVPHSANAIPHLPSNR